MYTINALTQFFEQYYWLFGTLLIVAGVFFTFLGRKLFQVAVFVVGMVITVFAILILFYTTFLNDNTESWVGWTVLAFSILIGCGIGFLFTKLVRPAGAILAGWGGFMLGLLINEAWLANYGSQAVFWCVCIGVALVCAIPGFILFNQAIMISTSFIGSYFIMRGISLFAGGFPPAMELVAEVKSGAITSVEPAFWGYVAGIVVVTILGSVVQFKMYAKMEEEKKHPYDRLA